MKSYSIYRHLQTVLTANTPFYVFPSDLHETWIIVNALFYTSMEVGKKVYTAYLHIYMEVHKMVHRFNPWPSCQYGLEIIRN